MPDTVFTPDAPRAWDEFDDPVLPVTSRTGAWPDVRDAPAEPGAVGGGNRFAAEEDTYGDEDKYGGGDEEKYGDGEGDGDKYDDGDKYEDGGGDTYGDAESGRGRTARSGDPDEYELPGWRERAGSALRERMPVWLQARCGMERRGVTALAVLLAVAAIFAVQHFWTGRTQSVDAPQAVRAETPFAGEGEGTEGEAAQKAGGDGEAGAPVAGAPVTAGAEIVVDVSGKVREPGIHRLPAGSRVVDALQAAGGVRPGTDTAGINRARFLVDGEQIVVGAPAAMAGAGGGDPGTSGGTPGASGAGGPGGPAAPVSLNTATVEQLDSLPGVGPVLAQHIVDYRTQHGGYRSVDELRQVSGIGDRRFSDLRNRVRP